MRWAKYSVLVAAITVTVVVVSPFAQGSTAANDPRVPGLIAKVAALQATVATLQGMSLRFKGTFPRYREA